MRMRPYVSRRQAAIKTISDDLRRGLRANCFSRKINHLEASRYGGRLMDVRLLSVGLTFLITGVVTLAADGPVTFHKDVEPILQGNCQTCHRPGQVAPMSFLTYQSVRPWAKAMKAAVLVRKMPPWFADPRHGPYLNDRSLKQNEIDTIAKWADAGAPE